MSGLGAGIDSFYEYLLKVYTHTSDYTISLEIYIGGRRGEEWGGEEWGRRGMGRGEEGGWGKKGGGGEEGGEGYIPIQY